MITLVNGDTTLLPNTTVVFVRRGAGGQHFGNPYSHVISALAPIRVGSRLEAVRRFADWLDGEEPSLEPERRDWILESIPTTIAGSYLICCPEGELCHAHVLAARANGFFSWVSMLREGNYATPAAAVAEWRRRLEISLATRTTGREQETT